MSDAASLYSDCSIGTGQALLPNTTGSTVCGVRSDKNGSVAAIASQCCEGITNYGCWSYCAYTNGLGEFSDCLDRSNASDYAMSTAFCFSNITGQHLTYASKSAAPGRRSAPTFSVLLLAIVLGCFFIAPTSASIIHSLGDDLEKRADDSCTINVLGNYTTIRNTNLVSGSFTCSGNNMCAYTLPVDTDIKQNNRTVNTTSAAEPEYNAFFSKLQDMTRRSFPAQSSVETQYSFMGRAGSTFELGWTPYAWCANGTTSGCGGPFGDSSTPAPFLACGPMFVTDAEDEIQGNLMPVTIA